MSSMENILIEQKPTTFRLLHINIHGLIMKDNLYEIQLQNLMTSNHDMISMNEINLNINKPEIYRQLYQGCRIKNLPVSVAFNHNHDPTPEVRKYGGVAIAATGLTASRVVEKEKDKFGRWVRYTLTGKGNKRISFISAYQCCEHNITDVASNSAFAQEKRNALERGFNPSQNPRDIFAQELRGYTEELLELGHEIVISMDANETPDTREGIITHLLEIGLLDAHKVLNPNLPHPPTYRRGNSCLDYVFVTQELAHALLKLEYLPYEQYNSDHKGISVEFCSEKLFGALTFHSQHQSKVRPFRTLDVKTATLYSQRLNELVDQHNLIERVKALDKKLKSLD
jgi:exonuclease III